MGGGLEMKWQIVSGVYWGAMAEPERFTIQYIIALMMVAYNWFTDDLFVFLQSAFFV
jgi:hypothetical protein